MINGTLALPYTKETYRNLFVFSCIYYALVKFGL